MVSAPADDLVRESFANGSSLVWRFNADDAIAMLTTTNADGSVERAGENVQGAGYTSFQKDFTAAGAIDAASFDNDDGSGKAVIFGSGLTISQASGQIGPPGDPGDFVYVSHANETYLFASGAANDVITFGAGFGNDKIIGFGAAGNSGDVLNLLGLFADFGAAQGAMTQAGANVVITDAQGDVLKLVGVAAGALTAGELGF